MKSKLLEACLNNNQSMVEDRVLAGDSMDEMTEELPPALSITSFFNYYDIARMLILNGANVNIKDKDWMSPLHYACLAGNPMVIKLLLSHSADVNSRDRMWQTPLHFASVSMTAECLELIGTKLKTFSQTDRIGWTALHHAAYHGCTACVAFLLDKGLNDKLLDKKDRSALHVAAQGGHAKVVTLLTERGFNPNARDKKGLTPLHYAAVRSQTEACQVLLSAGAAVDSATKMGNTPLHFACVCADISNVEFFVDEAGGNLDAVNKNKQNCIHLLCLRCDSYSLLNSYVTNENCRSQDAKGRAPIHYLAANGNIAGVSAIVTFRCDVDVVDVDGWSALHMACAKEELIMVDQLIKLGADINVSTNKGQSLAHFGVLSYNPSLLQLLLQAGCPTNLKDEMDRLPFHYALFCKSRENIEILVDNQLFDHTDSSGRNALAYACQSQNIEIVKLILKSGKVSVDYQDKDLCTALHVAAFYDSTGSVVQLLLDNDAKLLTDRHGFTALHYAIYGKQGNNVSLLLEKFGTIKEKNPINSVLHLLLLKDMVEYLPMVLNFYSHTELPVNHEGITPIHMAASVGNAPLLDTLLKHFDGADLHQGEGTYRYTPLHLAAMCSSIECLKKILDDHASQGADINARSVDGMTPLLIALIWGSTDYLVRYLVKKNADVNLASYDKKIAPIHVASMRGYMGLSHTFLSCGADPDVVTSNGRTSCILATQSGYLPCLRLLLKYNANLNIPDNCGCTAVHWACLKERVDILEFLLRRIAGKASDFQLGNSFSPLHCAVYVQNVECVELILKMIHKENFVTDSYNRTPLHVSATQSDVLITQMLLNVCGESVLMQDRLGSTPLHYAASNSVRAILEMMLSLEGDLGMKDNNGNTPAHVALLSNNIYNGTLLMAKMTPEMLEIRNNDGLSVTEICSGGTHNSSNDSIGGRNSS